MKLGTFILAGAMCCYRRQLLSPTWPRSSRPPDAHAARAGGPMPEIVVSGSWSTIIDMDEMVRIKVAGRRA